MRVFTCLSRNISMAYENEERRQRLHFKKKKRRSNPYDRRPLTPVNKSNQQPTHPVYDDAYDDCEIENIPPCGLVREQKGASSEQRVCLKTDSTTSVSSSSTSSNFLKRRSNWTPLPPIPTEASANASVYIKELDKTDEECNSDYLPLSQVFPPLREDDSEDVDSTYVSVGDYERPLSILRQSRPAVELRDTKTPAPTNTLSKTTATGLSSRDSTTEKSTNCDNYSMKTTRSCGTSSSTTSVDANVINKMKTVGSFNEAFIQSTGSLPHRTLSGLTVRSQASSTCLDTNSDRLCQNAAQNKLYPLQELDQSDIEGPVVKYSNCDLNGPAQIQFGNPYDMAQVETFKNNVIKTPDPYDTVEVEDEGSTMEVDVTYISSCSDTLDSELIPSSNSASEFLGCMSFGVQHLLKKDLDGWYYLLTEEVGRKKHLQAHTKSKPVLTTRSHQNIPQINRAVDAQERLIITIPRGKNGFGFSFIDELPPKVGRVDRASPAEQAGVRKGDLVVRVNGQNVSRSTCEGVAHLVKKMNPSSLTLELQRDHTIPTTEVTAYGTQQPHHPATYGKKGVGTSTDHLYESIMEKSSRDHHKENRAMAAGDISYEDGEYLTEDETAYSQHGIPNQPGITSTPRPFIGASHKSVDSLSSNPMNKHESIHRLMSMELDYIDFMHYGIERYSRPLRHCIVSAHQHMTIFQNVEKLVTISEFHIKQMQENNSSVNSDTDDSQSSESSIFPNSIALIYQSKIHMLCQAYETYANGLVRSNTLLRELRKNRDFMNFIKEPASEDGQPLGHPPISAFINRPVQHIQELHSVLSEIFSATPLHSPDFATLQQIVIKLSQCITAITGLSSACRVQSLDSLTSSQGKASSQTTSSGKGSMASLSSTASSSEADLLRPMIRNSAASVRSMDKDVIRIQERLVFPPHVTAFQLCQEDRHFIYKGDIFRCSKGSWFKSQLLLFSDLLLMVDEEADGSLCVLDNPITVQDLAGIEFNRKYASEFVLHLHPSTSTSLPRKQHLSTMVASDSFSKKLTLRAPSGQEKFVWKSLLEQRVSANNGSRLQHYGSMKDISNVKTSVIL